MEQVGAYGVQLGLSAVKICQRYTKFSEELLLQQILITYDIQTETGYFQECVISTGDNVEFWKAVMSRCTRINFVIESFW